MFGIGLHTETRTFKNEFAVSELVENELGPLGKWNYSETIFILNTVQLIKYGFQFIFIEVQRNK